MERPPTSTRWHPWSGLVRSSSSRRRCWWDIELGNGVISYAESHFGTATGAKAKAERLIAKLEARDRARIERTFEVCP